MSSFLKSHRKHILPFILASIITLLLAQTVISIILFQARPKILNYLKDSFGYRVNLDYLSFNFLRGLQIKDFAVFYDTQDTPPLIIKDASFCIKILPSTTLFLHLDIKEAFLTLKKEEAGLNLQIIFSDIYKKMQKNKSPILPKLRKGIIISVRKAKLIYAGNHLIKENAHIFFRNARIKQESEKFNFDSTVELNYFLSKDMYISRLFKNKNLEQEVKYSAQGSIGGENLNINMVSIKIGKNQILGMGISKGFAERNPYLDIAFMPSSILLEQITPLKDNFNAKGNAFLTLRLSGPMDNTHIDVSGNFFDCNFEYPLAAAEVLNIKKFSGNLDYRNNQLKIEKGYLNLEKVPLNIDLVSVLSGEPEITLRVSLLEDFFIAQNLPLKKLEVALSGKIKDTFTGNLELAASYIRRGLNLEMRADLKNIDFDYAHPREKYLRVENIELSKDNSFKMQKLNFTNLDSKVYFNKNGLEIKGLNFSGYHAIINGEIKLDTKDETSLSFIMEGLGLDVKPLMRDINITDKLLYGNMDAKVTFDNQQKEFLQGNCQIKSGAVDLGILADIIKLQSLKNVHFETLDLSFMLSKQTVGVDKVNLLSKDIVMNASWDTNGKIEGGVNLKIAAKLLKQSTTFRKLIRLARIKAPFIEFDFLLGGMPKAMRVMWMKGEFKDEIKKELSPWVKRSIEKNIDQMIDELSN